MGEWGILKVKVNWGIGRGVVIVMRRGCKSV